MAGRPREGAGRRLRTPANVLLLLLVWVVVAVPVAGKTFLHSSRATVVAGHDAVIRPTLDGWARIDLGPVLPSVRYPSGSRVGADITLGKTTLQSYEALVDRYVSLAAQPDAQIAKVRRALLEMAWEAVLVGTLAGLVVPGVFLLLGPRRRRELTRDRRARVRSATVLAVVAALAVATAARPWDRDPERLPATAWQPLSSALPDVRIPARAAPLQVDAGLLTVGTSRLVESAVRSYRTSSSFYAAAAASLSEVAAELHQPADDEVVAVLVSDRHDNVGMDPVARAVADAGGATFLLDAGDDTSTGSPWESFSLESLDEAFAGLDERFYVAGNHDNGDFVTSQAADLGFTLLEGAVVEAPGGVRLMGQHDPRSSGLGNWRDEIGLSFDDVADRLADAACAADADGQRVATLLVHDADLGRGALERGCVDLVAAGHLHVVVGPDRVLAEDGRLGYTYTTASTGGAAYAIAIGTKPRRDAVVSLLTYRDGRPVGVQAVSLSPLGRWTVGSYTALEYADGGPAPETDEGPVE